MVQETEMMQMFSQEELNSVDPKYFNIILLNPYDVTVQGKNTGHYWRLHRTGEQGRMHAWYITNINISILTTSTGMETVSDKQSGVSRAIIGGI